MDIRFVRLVLFSVTVAVVPSYSVLPIADDDVPTWCEPNYYWNDEGGCVSCETCKVLTRPPSGCQTCAAEPSVNVNYVVVGVASGVSILVIAVAVFLVLLYRRRYMLQTSRTDMERQDTPTQTEEFMDPTAGTPSKPLLDNDDDDEADVSMEQGIAEHDHSHIGTESNEGQNGPTSSTTDYPIVPL